MSTGRSIPPMSGPGQQLLVETVNELNGVSRNPGRRAVRFSELVAAGLVAHDERGAIRSGKAIEDVKTKLLGVEGEITAFTRSYEGIVSQLENVNGELLAQSEKTTALRTAFELRQKVIDGQLRTITAQSDAVQQLTTRITANERSIDVMSRQQVRLQSQLTMGEGTLSFISGEVSANATAVQTLETRVIATEGSISSHAASITALQSTVNHPSTGVNATASGLSSLTTRVTNTENSISSNSSSITALQSTVNHPSTGVNATASAVQTLDTRVDTQDGKITTLYAQHTLTLDVNNRITGWKFINDGTTGLFDIVADRMRITKPAGIKSIEFADGIISSTTASHARYFGVDFGSPGTYIDWFGPKPAAGPSGAVDANALFYLKNDGSAYFGGALSTAKVIDKLPAAIVLNVVNPSFEQGLLGWTDAYSAGDLAWFYTEAGGNGSATRLVRAFNAGSGGRATAGLVNNTGSMSVSAGKRVRMSIDVYRTSVGTDGMIGHGVAYYNSAGGYLGGDWLTMDVAGTALPVAWQRLSRVSTAPADAAIARAAFVVGSMTAGYWYFDNVQLDEEVQNLDDVAHGPTYGRVVNTDLIDSGGVRRLGLRVKGSGQYLGGPRNIRAAQVVGFNAVRSSSAVTANSSGQISINAHTVELGGETVTYNAVPNAIVGAVVGTTYVIYTLDPSLDGGTRTYYAQTTILSAAQSGEGAVHIGTVTIPASGSAEGGEGGGGNPGEWCVDADMLLPGGKRARDVQAGDAIECWDERSGTPGTVHLLVQSNALSPQPVWRIVTDSGAEVWASQSTPMPVPYGHTDALRITEMLGRSALVRRRDGSCAWERVVVCEPVGLRDVAFIRVNQHCYFAGVSPEATIATHNPTQKP